MGPLVVFFLVWGGGEGLEEEEEEEESVSEIMMGSSVGFLVAWEVAERLPTGETWSESMIGLLVLLLVRRCSAMSLSSSNSDGSRRLR